MADLLILHGTVITMNPERRVIEDGAVAITGDRIVAIGTTDEITAAHDAPETIDARRKAVLPGLIDVHAHAGHGLIKTFGGERHDVWYKACEIAYTVASTPAFWRAEAQLAALERLRFGVTTGVSLLGGGDSIMRTDAPEYGDAHVDGVLEVGTRSVVAIGSTRPPFPRTYADWNGDDRTEKPVSFAEQMATCRDLIARWHGSNGVRIGMAMLTPTIREEHVAELDAALLKEAKDQAIEARALSRETGTIFTQDGHQAGSVAIAHELGLLGPDALLSHAIGLPAEEIDLVAGTDTRIAHNPSAVASIMGRCPATEMMERGVTVALGSDATAPDRSADMFRHMQQAMHYHRTHHRDPDWLPPGRTLSMCTIDGAVALGMDADIGSLEVGKKADVTLLDLARPHLTPFNMPVMRIVYFANGNDVSDVIVDGRVLMSDRKVSSVDETAILDAADAETARFLERADMGDLTETRPGFWHGVRYES